MADCTSACPVLTYKTPVHAELAWAAPASVCIWGLDCLWPFSPFWGTGKGYCLTHKTHSTEWQTSLNSWRKGPRKHMTGQKIPSLSKTSWKETLGRSYLRFVPSVRWDWILNFINGWEVGGGLSWLRKLYCSHSKGEAAGSFSWRLSGCIVHGLTLGPPALAS